MRVRALLAIALVAAGCGGSQRGPAPSPTRAEGPGPTPRKPSAPPLRRARCPAGLARCRAVLGRVVLVERHDPDGDGDLHVVVTDGGITAPGLTAIDVARELRPARDPRLGDLATAAGQVQPGTYRQAQIHATTFAARPPGGGPR